MSRLPRMATWGREASHPGGARGWEGHHSTLRKARSTEVGRRPGGSGEPPGPPISRAPRATFLSNMAHSLAAVTSSSIATDCAARPARLSAAQAGCVVGCRRVMHGFGGEYIRGCPMLLEGAE
jgi:hypothetical protein